MKLITKHEQKVIEEELLILMSVFDTAMKEVPDEYFKDFLKEVFCAGMKDVLFKACGKNAVHRMELEFNDDEPEGTGDCDDD